MAKLCYITTCKGRLAHLKQTLPRIVAQPDVSCVVVDYSCPDKTADWVAANFPQVRLVRVRGEEQFNLARARNLGAQAADAPWLGFFDADILLDADFASEVMPRLTAGFFYRANPVTSQTWGSIVCHIDDFTAVGGYDETYVGWGGEDDDLIALLTLAGKRVAGIPARLLDEIPHSDEQRVQFKQLKDRWVQSRINQLYLQIKIDLLRLLGQPLSAEERRAIFGEISRTVMLGESGNRLAPQSIEINLPGAAIGSLPGNGTAESTRLQRKLTYTYSIDGAVANAEQAGN